MHQISIEQATAQIAAVFGEAMRGQEVIITDHEIPVVKVIPFGTRARKRRTPGRAIGMISNISEDFDSTPPGFEEYL